MRHKLINYILMFVIMLLSQVVICNHILLFGVATPIVFIYFILRLPISMSVNMVLTLSFLSGLSVDIFSDTLGINTLACTLLAVVRKPIFNLYHSKDDESAELSPRISSLGLAEYMKYLFTTVLVYCSLTITIEYFSFSDLSDMLFKICGSTMLSFVLLLGIDSLIIERREKRL